MCSSSITFRYSTPVTIIIMMIIMIISETLGYYIPSSSSSTSHGNGYSYSNHKNGYSLNNYPGYSNYNRDYTKGYNSYNTRTSSYPMSSSSDSSYPSSSSPSYLAAVNRDIPSYTRGYSYSSSGNYGNGYSNSPVKDYHKDYSTSSSINYPSYTTSSGSNSGSSTTSSSNSDLISKHYEQDIYALNKGYPNKLNLHLPHMPNINLPQINLPQLPPLNNFYPKRYPTKYPTYTSTKYPAFDPSTATPFLTTSSSLPPLPSTMSSTTPENSPVIVKPHKRPITRRPVIHQYPVASSSLPYFETTSHSSNIYPSNFDPHPTTPPVNDASTGGMGLLYVFSEASKRLPINDFPKTVENFGDQFISWSEDAVKIFEKQAVNIGDTLVEFLQSAAKDVTVKAGDMITSGFDSLERTVKGVLADWIGCAKPKG